MLSILEDLSTHSWTVQNDWILENERRELLSWAKNLRAEGHFKPARITRQAQRSESIRGDEILWLEENSSALTQLISQKLKTLQEDLNQNLFCGLERFEFHLACYPTGKHYDAHYDQPRHLANLPGGRAISFILYLNDDWQDEEGGELVLFDSKDSSQIVTKVLPLGGRLVMFRSDVILHEVRAPNRERWSLTGWFHRR